MKRMPQYQSFDQCKFKCFTNMLVNFTSLEWVSFVLTFDD